MYFIKVGTGAILDQVKKSSDYTTSDLYELYNHITSIKSTTVCTLCESPLVSVATIAAMNEKYMKTAGDVSVSDLKIIYVSDVQDVLLSLTGIGKSLMHNKLLLRPEQIIRYGVADTIPELGTTFTARKIEQMKSNSLQYVYDEISESPVHIILDMTLFAKKSSVDCITNMIALIKRVRKQLVAIDITGFTDTYNYETSIVLGVIRECLVAAGVQERKINIFDEDSRFLIYRSEDQEDIEADIGWYVLTDIPMSLRNDLLKMIEPGVITSVTIDDEEYMVMSTSLNEQNSMSYYTASILDGALFPAEKVAAGFELISETVDPNTSATD